MNKTLLLLSLTLIAFVLSSCVAGSGNEPAADALLQTTKTAEQSTNMAPALKAVTTQSAEEKNNVTDDATDQTNMSQQDGDADIVQSGPVEPVTVDLGQITPQANTGGELEIMPAPRVPDEMVAMVAKVSQDLAQRLNIDVEKVTLVTAEAVEWRDSSLGCPEPDMMYMMVITPGYRVVLEANDQLYEYHTGRNDVFVFCPDIKPAVQPIDPNS